MNKLTAIVVAGVVAMTITLSSAVQTMATTSPNLSTHCGERRSWGGTISTTYSNGVKLHYWSADAGNGAQAYCFLAQRKSAPKNTYINLARDNGAGRYGRYSTTLAFVLKSGQSTEVTVSLFKKSGENAKTYWKSLPIPLAN